MFFGKIQRIELIPLVQIPCEPWGLAVSAHQAFLPQMYLNSQPRAWECCSAGHRTVWSVQAVFIWL